MTDEEKTRAELLAQIQALESEQFYEHRANGYKLSPHDVSELARLVQRALHEGQPDALKQFIAIEVAYKIHGKVSFEQMKLLKEVSDVFNSYHM